jgi:glycosidase
LSAFAQTPPSITKVDPPSWWANHSINPVRLLVRGKNLSGARISSSNPALRVSKFSVNDKGTYLFVDVDIDSAARPGEYPLVVETAAGRDTIPFRLESPLDTPNSFQGITSDDVIYLIMIDRFADGDASNNAPKDSPPEANDRQNPRGFHGGDLRGIINQLPYLKELGITAIWLTPWYDNWNGVNRCDKSWCPNTYYHGYHAIDYYAVEDRFGDLATLRDLVRKAHALGIKIIQDQVANHVGSQHPWVRDPPLANWFHGTRAQHQLNKFQNRVLLSPHSNELDIRNTLDGWFNDDLPDMNQDEPEVARYDIQNALWWVGVTGIDGIRQDTIQYMPRTFIRDLSNALHRQYPKLWMVGEVFERDAAHTAFFIGGHTGWDGIDTKLDSVFDFSLWNVSQLVFTNKAPVWALGQQLKYDALYPDAARLTVLANNHDTTRFLSLEGATVNGAMMHAAFILSVRGIPQLYAGEEIAMEGKDDPDNRRDFPVRAFTSGGREPREREMFEWTRSWIRLRREHAAMRSGRLIDLFYDNDTYVFARQLGTETVIVAFNRANQKKRVTIPAGSIRLKDRDVTLELPAQSAVAFTAF